MDTDDENDNAAATIAQVADKEQQPSQDLAGCKYCGLITPAKKSTCFCTKKYEYYCRVGPHQLKNGHIVANYTCKKRNELKYVFFFTNQF
jgi:hypothetical protein